MGKTGRKNNSYSAEFKLKAVEQYLSGEIGGLTIATSKLGLCSKTQLQEWIKLYRQDPELLKRDGRKLGRMACEKEGQRRPGWMNCPKMNRSNI